MHLFRAYFRRVLRPIPATDEATQALGISPWLWRLYVVFWLISLGYTVLLLLQTRLNPLRVGFILGGGVILAGSYLGVMLPHPSERLTGWRPRFAWALLGFVTLVVVVFSLSLFDDPAWLWLCICVSAIAGILFAPRRAVLMVTTLTLLCLLVGWVRLGWMTAIPLALLVRGLGIDMIGVILLMRALQRLQRQRQALARLAVTAERLRVARDLHDLLGRNLAAVTLKSALAERLVSVDPIRARAEMRAVEALARATLREVRVALAGYRQMTIAHEIEGARQILLAAGITLSMTADRLTLPPRIEGAFASVIHEGVTNILRHSQATQCQIMLGCTAQVMWLEITNDGGVPGVPPSEPGQGIGGLRERLVALGGGVLAERRDPDRFFLRAEAPFTEEGTP
ncbi:MAG: sensor histidine kinase [Ktedonobacterales bacterium]|nr:sensor histidine kinase [Ktedonobacterales bacterium]